MPRLPHMFRTSTHQQMLSAEYTKICTRTAVGFIVMGFIGFFVKLIFIVSTIFALCMEAWAACCVLHSLYSVPCSPSTKSSSLATEARSQHQRGIRVCTARFQASGEA